MPNSENNENNLQSHTLTAGGLILELKPIFNDAANKMFYAKPVQCYRKIEPYPTEGLIVSVRDDIGMIYHFDLEGLDWNRVDVCAQFGTLDELTPKIR